MMLRVENRSSGTNTCQCHFAHKAINRLRHGKPGWKRSTKFIKFGKNLSVVTQVNTAPPVKKKKNKNIRLILPLEIIAYQKECDFTGRIDTTAKSNLSPSVPLWTTRLPLQGFWRNLIFQCFFSQIGRRNSNLKTPTWTLHADQRTILITPRLNSFLK